ncbi:MAG TPA: hypothetical protein PLK12_16645 [Prolixibacteraceae bacterium]|nr:hypothetical protein [Prolixibacteraceae bacterium]
MISIDLLEVLLRSIPQYLLFGALALYLFAWIDRKPLLGKIAEIVLIVTGALAALVLVSGSIPPADTPGLEKENVERVIKMLLMLGGTGLLAAVSIVIRYANKKAFNLLVIAIFVATLVQFFQLTRLSKVKFELNVPEQTNDSLPYNDTLSVPDDAISPL